jgi:hypothetical protein
VHPLAIERLPEPAPSPAGEPSPLAESPYADEHCSGRGGVGELQAALKVVTPPAPVRGVVWVTPVSLASVPASIASKVPGPATSVVK